MKALDSLQQDALIELFNVGVGHAAALLSGMVGDTISFNVPFVEFKSRAEAAHVLAEAGGDRLNAIKERFSGSFQGEALLMFPEANSLELVRLVVGRHVPLDMLSTLEADALNEVGNILLNACLSSISEMMSFDFDCEIPTLAVGSPHEIFGIDESRAGDVLFLHISFAIESSQINGYIAFLLDAPAVEKVRDGLNMMITGVVT